MNYFAHALPFLDDPYYAAATGVPDWLTVVDRKVRVRLKHTDALAEDGDPVTRAVARGVAQHIRDDRQFHGSRAFVELCFELTAAAGRALGGEKGLRPGFLGHLLVEVLLDDALAAEAPERLDAYYRLLDDVDEKRVEEVVNRMAPRPTNRLAWMISRFREARILWDYREDGKLMGRLNQVMRRVRLEELPEAFAEILPDARRRVMLRSDDLLEGIPA